MDLILFIVGLFGFAISLFLLIIFAIRRKPKKKPLIAMGICFVLVFVGLSMPNADSESSETISEGSQLTKADIKILKKDFNELDDDERTRLIIMQGDMNIKELKEYKSDLKRLYVQEMSEAYGSEDTAKEMFEENFDYEIRKRNGELTEEEKEEDRKREENAKEFVEESKNEFDIEEAIISVVGETNNMDNKSISNLDINENYGTEEDGDKLIIANINASENLTNNMTKKGILIDSAKIFENLFKINNISEVTLNWDFPLVDQYGNEEIGTILRVTIDKEIVKKINWENFNNDNLANISKEYWEHPALSK